jgi:hypothetical protein
MSASTTSRPNAAVSVRAHWRRGRASVASSTGRSMRRNAEHDGLSVTGEAFNDRFAAIAVIRICYASDSNRLDFGHYQDMSWL